MSADGQMPPGATEAQACRVDWGAICDRCSRVFMPDDDETKCPSCEKEDEE